MIWTGLLIWNPSSGNVTGSKKRRIMPSHNSYTCRPFHYSSKSHYVHMRLAASPFTVFTFECVFFIIINHCHHVDMCAHHKFNPRNQTHMKCTREGNFQKTHNQTPLYKIIMINRLPKTNSGLQTWHKAWKRLPRHVHLRQKPGMNMW